MYGDESCEPFVLPPWSGRPPSDGGVGAPDPALTVSPQSGPEAGVSTDAAHAALRLALHANDFALGLLLVAAMGLAM